MPHLWLALSPHGFGHAAMTAPVIAEVQRRLPGLRLTIQSTVKAEFLHSRYRDFNHVAQIADFGFLMKSATSIDMERSAAAYAEMIGFYDSLVAENADLMRADFPDLVVSNVAFVPLSAADLLGCSSVALSSLNWADMYMHYFSHRPEGTAVAARLVKAYESADVFLRCTPAPVMSMSNVQDVGPVSVVPKPSREKLRAALGVPLDHKIGLVAFGGIDHDIAFDQWPSLPGWLWLTPPPIPDRSDMYQFDATGLDFSSLVASVDVIITKPGYGTFTEAAMCGTPVLYTLRQDWPECPHLDHWLARHTQCLGVAAETLVEGLESSLHKLFSMPRQQVASPDGVSEAADVIVDKLLKAHKANV